MTVISVRVKVKRGRWLFARAVLGVANAIAWCDPDLAFRFVQWALKPLCEYDDAPRGY